MSIEQQLDLKFPIYWNDWPIERDFAKYLIYSVVVNRPINIVEFGSGTSTLILLKTLEKLGYEYKLISIDSDDKFLERTKNLLIAEGVYSEKKVNLIFAEITEIELGGNNYKWYNPKKIDFISEKIDLMFIDGPLGALCKNSRYPAIPIMKKHFKKGTLVILHDAKRVDETEVVEMWRIENREINTISKIETKCGGIEIQF